MAAKKSAKKSASKPAKKSVKKAVAKRPAAKKSAAKKSVAKKSATKRAPKKSSPKKSATTVVRSAKIEIPTAPTPAKAPVTTAAPAKSENLTVTRKSSPAVLFMVIAGVVLLAIFALSNASTNDDAAPDTTPTASESPAATTSPTEEPSEEPSESESPAANLVYEAPTSFVAINNASGGVTLRWKAPAAVEGLTGYLISISYNAVDFKEVSTVPADQFSLDIARVGDDGGTQFFIQSVYSDGTKADGKKFSLRGKYE